MPLSPYIADVRAKLGHDLLLLPSVSAAIVNERGDLLLAKHDDLWSTIGGLIEPDESPQQAVVREIKEETNLDAELLGIVGVYGGQDCRVTYSNGDQVAFVSTMFGLSLAHDRLDDHDVVLETGEGILDLGWFAPEQLDGLPLQPWIHRALADAYAWARTRRSEWEPTGLSAGR
ncbi:hypothetical protein GCM10009841_10270 [Microlunatus panaciterrae]|uniref:8-oxo-dGTP pyrophosphatase MutT (NUDIX family) n=1 Tax=Microlunatus panaciterrae TaxID=400768 RepID=A0ABS2RKN9_9ACTN|nr:NUDIX domain-containing protein [Microlunatus panaciterrae]MBM7799575.1 8-oxo-dGTP pyrophosphatase MutT (NUDIX family) [Microlunatus panaciterrae]